MGAWQKMGRRSVVVVLLVSMLSSCMAVPAGVEGDEVDRGGLAGTIRYADGMVVIGATVNLSNGWTAVTDDQGRFVFNEVPSGNYTLTVRMEGFPPLYQNVEVGAGQTIDLGTMSLQAGTLGGGGSEGARIILSTGLLVAAMIVFFLVAGNKLRR